MDRPGGDLFSPVPVSPVIRTVERRLPIRLMISTTSRIAALEPTSRLPVCTASRTDGLAFALRWRIANNSSSRRSSERTACETY